MATPTTHPHYSQSYSLAWFNSQLKPFLEKSAPPPEAESKGPHTSISSPSARRSTYKISYEEKSTQLSTILFTSSTADRLSTSEYLLPANRYAEFLLLAAQDPSFSPSHAHPKGIGNVRSSLVQLSKEKSGQNGEQMQAYPIDFERQNLNSDCAHIEHILYHCQTTGCFHVITLPKATPLPTEARVEPIRGWDANTRARHQIYQNFRVFRDTLNFGFPPTSPPVTTCWLLTTAGLQQLGLEKQPSPTLSASASLTAPATTVSVPPPPPPLPRSAAIQAHDYFTHRCDPAWWKRQQAFLKTKHPIEDEPPTFPKKSYKIYYDKDEQAVTARPVTLNFPDRYTSERSQQELSPIDKDNYYLTDAEYAYFLSEIAASPTHSINYDLAAESVDQVKEYLNSAHTSRSAEDLLLATQSKTDLAPPSINDATYAEIRHILYWDPQSHSFRSILLAKSEEQLGASTTDPYQRIEQEEDEDEDDSSELDQPTPRKQRRRGKRERKEVDLFLPSTPSKTPRTPAEQRTAKWRNFLAFRKAYNATQTDAKNHLQYWLLTDAAYQTLRQDYPLTVERNWWILALSLGSGYALWQLLYCLAETRDFATSPAGMCLLPVGLGLVVGLLLNLSLQQLAWNKKHQDAIPEEPWLEWKAAWKPLLESNTRLATHTALAIGFWSLTAWLIERYAVAEQLDTLSAIGSHTVIGLLLGLSAGMGIVVSIQSFNKLSQRKHLSHPLPGSSTLKLAAPIALGGAAWYWLNILPLAEKAGFTAAEEAAFKVMLTFTFMMLAFLLFHWKNASATMKTPLYDTKTAAASREATTPSSTEGTSRTVHIPASTSRESNSSNRGSGNSSTEEEEALRPDHPDTTDSDTASTATNARRVQDL